MDIQQSNVVGNHYLPHLNGLGNVRLRILLNVNHHYHVVEIPVMTPKLGIIVTLQYVLLLPMGVVKTNLVPNHMMKNVVMENYVKENVPKFHLKGFILEYVF